MLRTKISIYTDEGVAEEDLPELKRSLEIVLSDRKNEISFINSAEIINGTLQYGCNILIIPGGRDLPYCAKLKGSGNRMIRSFVENGGSYLGICAGGYYGTSYVDFDRGGSLEVCGEREMKFFEGSAIGPAFGTGTYHYDSLLGARIAKLSLGDFLKDRLAQSEGYSYYNGGCYFVPNDSSVNYQILARFADIKDNPAAIIFTNFGKGKVVLSGVHPEISNTLIMPRNKELGESLLEINDIRLSIFKELISSLI